jgi:hypothetical protein
VHDPPGGGRVVHRIRFPESELEDVGWLINESPSASRWIGELGHVFELGAGRLVSPAVRRRADLTSPTDFE